MYISVQYLRALAALFVLLAHIGFKLEVHSINLLSSYKIGSYGVDFFFIISGFIMCLTIDKNKSTVIAFMKARFIRIIPLYWILSFVALIIFLVNPSLVNSSGGQTSIWASFTLIPNGDKYLINNGWTLSFEFFFYLVFSLFIPFGAGQKALTILALLSLSIIGLLVDTENSYFKFITSPLLLEFVMGIVAYKLIQFKRIKLIYSIVLISASLSLLFYVNGSGLESKDVIFGRALYAGLPMMMLFLGVVSIEHLMPKDRILYNIGMSSYSLYLLHPFTLSAVTVCFSLVGLMDYAYLYFFSMLLVSCLSGWVCYKFIELPIGDKIRKLSSSDFKFYNRSI